VTRRQLVTVLLGLALATPASAQIAITQLSSVDAAGRCTIRPTVGATVYAKMMAGGLSHAQLLHHASSRLGFGASPIGPLTVASANDCSSVFVADELARQVAALGAVSDTAQLTTIRRGVTPLTMFDRADLSGALSSLRQTALEASQTTAWEARTSLTYLKTLRELVGSQRVVSTQLVDVQIALDEVMLELWIDHFNIELEKPSYYAHGKNGYTEVLRRAHGGTFTSLLTTVMRQPAFLFYSTTRRTRAIRSPAPRATRTWRASYSSSTRSASDRPRVPTRRPTSRPLHRRCADGTWCRGRRRWRPVTPASCSTGCWRARDRSPSWGRHMQRPASHV
jgi:Protein of unknown function (DUF1800)